MKETITNVAKVDNFTLEVTVQPETPPEITTSYDRDTIVQQIADITAQRDEMIAAKQAELDECNAILNHMDTQGIVSKAATLGVVLVDVKPLPVVGKIV